MKVRGEDLQRCRVEPGAEILLDQVELPRGLLQNLLAPETDSLRVDSAEFPARALKAAVGAVMINPPSSAPFKLREDAPVAVIRVFSYNRSNAGHHLSPAGGSTFRRHLKERIVSYPDISFWIPY